MLIGRLGHDPEMTKTPSGVSCAKLNLATNRSWKDDAGNPVEKTDWHRVVAWRGLADICGQYLKKGALIYIEGRLETRSYDGKDGKKVYATEVIADNMTMLGGKGDSAPKSEPKPRSDAEIPPDLSEDDLPF